MNGGCVAVFGGGGRALLGLALRRSATMTTRTTSDRPDVALDNHRERNGEPLHQMKARLLYQSRKRGMLENGLLLSTFAHEHLDAMTEEQTHQYDSIINRPSNDWDLFYWMLGSRQTPPEFDNAVMDMLKEHARNDRRELRLRQPDLKTP